MGSVNLRPSRLGFALDAGAKAPAVWGALLAAAGLAWAVTVRGALEMDSAQRTMGRALGEFLIFWIAMMAAMMLPSVAPVGSLYVRSVCAGLSGVLRVLRVAGVVLGYLGVWAAFGVVAFVAAWAAQLLATGAPSAAPWMGAAIVAAAGVYQLTPLKNRCLRHCRSPLGFLLHFGGYSGRLRDIRVGVYHGVYCVGCCWALFVVLIAVGVMNLVWMAGLAAVIFLEKTWRYGKTLSLGFGIALLIVSVFVPFHPELVPGLDVDSRMGTMPMER
jgi:predicted metal-binding membrane protein